MKLPFSFGKKEKPEYFLLLLLREEKANAIIVEQLLGKIRVVGEHEEHFEDSVENASLDELLDILDKAISTAETSLPEEIETHKTIFGLKENWIEDSKIKKEYLVKLKKASEQLGLSPIGFLIIHEAIAHLMQKEEGAPVSAILIEVGKKAVAISVLRAGRIVDTQRAKVEDSIAKTTDKLLHHFDIEVLPSRIVLFNDESSEELSQEFISHSWSKSLAFLHVPQIRTLPKGFDARAILAGAASQMGFEVLGQDLPEEKEMKEPELTIHEEKALAEAQKEQGKEGDEETEEEEVIEEEPEQEKIEEEKQEEENDTVSDNEIAFGFLSEEDVALAPKVEEEKEKPISEPSDEEDFGESHDSAPSFFPVMLAKSVQLGEKLKKINKIKLPSLTFLKSLKLNGLKQKNRMVIIPAAILLVIFLLLLYIFGLHAQIILDAKTKTLEKDADITFAKDAPTDISNNIIASDFVTISQDGTTTTQATGKKEIGDKAKGSVTVYNSLNQSQTFQQGTTLISDNGLKFSLDKDVTIASASGDPISGIKSGTAQAFVTAADIGKEYNLPSGSRFSISGASSAVAAKNDSAFSGGSKKDITVVSKDDTAKLEQDLTKQLEQQAKDEASKKVSPDRSLLPFFADESLTDKKLDKQVGDEASNVTLTAAVSFKGVSYKKSDFEMFSTQLLEKDNSDFTTSSNGITETFDNVKQKNDTEVLATAHIKAALLPKFDEKKTAQDLAGKSFDTAKTQLSHLPQVENVLIKLSPGLPFLPKILPRIGSHIKISVRSNG